MREQAGGRLEERSRELREGPRDGGSDPDPDTGDGASMWERIEGQAAIAPVMGNPSLEPAHRPYEVAMMAGWGAGDGYDAMMDVDKMVLGEVDATRELEANSATEGRPLQLGRSEDLDRSVEPRYELSFPDPEGGDWTTHL